MVLGHWPGWPLYSACLKPQQEQDPAASLWRGFPLLLPCSGHFLTPAPADTPLSCVEPAGHPQPGRTQQISLTGQLLTHLLMHLRGLPWCPGSRKRKGMRRQIGPRKEPALGPRSQSAAHVRHIFTSCSSHGSLMCVLHVYGPSINAFVSSPYTQTVCVSLTLKKHRFEPADPLKYGFFK